jgi:putative transposase
MPRRLRVSTGGFAYHVLNRAVGRGRLFDKDADFFAFERVLGETQVRLSMRIISYCLMSNHWHLVLWPEKDGQLSEFMRLLTVTHTQRWHAHHHTAGTGPVYQGRFKSFPIQQDHHFLNVCRYVERNPLTANLVKSARNWAYSSLSARLSPKPHDWLLPTSDWPVQPPRNWTQSVDRPLPAKELEAIRTSVKRGRPYGQAPWQTATAKKLSLQSTLRPRGRPTVDPITDS